METPLYYPDPVPFTIPGMTGTFLKRIKFAGFAMTENLDLSLKERVDFFTDDNGALGQPISDYFDSLTELSNSEKSHYKQMFQPYERTFSTAGNKIHPVTGQIVEPNVYGTYPGIHPLTGDLVQPNEVGIYPKVESQTGELLWPDENGDYPAGAVELIDLVDEKMSFITLPLSSVPEYTLPAFIPEGAASRVVFNLCMLNFSIQIQKKKA